MRADASRCACCRSCILPDELFPSSEGSFQVRIADGLNDQGWRENYNQAGQSVNDMRVEFTSPGCFSLGSRYNSCHAVKCEPSRYTNILYYVLHSLLCLKIDSESRSYSYLAFHFNFSSGIFDHLFDNVQANTGAFYVGMQAFEEGENLALLAHVHA